jgi:hypothetical protein
MKKGKLLLGRAGGTFIIEIDQEGCVYIYEAEE